MVRKIFGGKKCRKSAYPQISKKCLANFGGFQEAEKLIFIVVEERLDDNDVDVFPAATVAGSGKYINLASGQIAHYDASQTVFPVDKMHLNPQMVEYIFLSSIKTSVSVEQMKKIFGENVIC